MYDSWEYLIPANTLETALKTLPVHISLGVITDVFIGFPAGCGKYDVATDTTWRLARCRLLHGSATIAPRSPKKFLAADDYVIHVPQVNHPVLSGDPILTWELWNLDDTYPHELWLGVNWIPKEELDAELLQLQEMGLTMEQVLAAIRQGLRV